MDPFSQKNLLLQSDTYNESSMFITTSRLVDNTSEYVYNDADSGFHTEVPYGDHEEAQRYNTEGLEVHEHISLMNPWDQSVFDTMNLDIVMDNEDTENLHEQPNEDLRDRDGLEAMKKNTNNIQESQINEDKQVSNEDQEHANTQADDIFQMSNELTEEDIELFLENENSTEDQGVPEPINNKYIPEVGMQFNNSDEAKHFCNEDAYMAGFSMVIASTYRTISKKRNNEITKMTLKCNKQGKISEKDHEIEESIVQERHTSVVAKTGCKVTVIVKEDSGVWKISSTTLDHNHPLGPHSETKFFRTHKYMSVEEKTMIRNLKKVNTPTRNMVAILSYMRGGRANLSYDDKDVANYSYKVGRERTMNDMTQMLQYFSNKQAESPGFYYSVDMDNDYKVRNIFWADAKAREYYTTYGDCISFDTTFLTNKYNLPFAPFVGVSTHANTYIFACAFLGDETADTFSWVFGQFLKAMNDKNPKSIITDQDGAMRKAIGLVFPGTTHRSCWFHVKKTLEEKMVKVFPKKKGLYEEMKDILDNSLTEAEFEHLWQKLMADFDLHHIKHLNEIWEKGKRFIPVYFKNSFFPFIQSTGRSEGINGVFKRGVGPQYSLMSFINEYHRISDTIQNREDKMDYHTRNRNMKVLWSKYYC